MYDMIASSFNTMRETLTVSSHADELHNDIIHLHEILDYFVTYLDDSHDCILLSGR